jgi:CRP-like cAMP-binding protein
MLPSRSSISRKSTRFGDDILVDDAEHEQQLETAGLVRRFLRKLDGAVAFEKSSSAYVNMVLEAAQEMHIEPHEVVFRVGEQCTFGITPFYVVLEGRLMFQNELEVRLGPIDFGEIFGEGGALCLTEDGCHDVTVAAGDTPAVILMIDGSVLESALIAFPEERERLDELHNRRSAIIQDFEMQRAAWVEQVVVPALTGTALFAGCPVELLEEVAAPLLEYSYKKGQIITHCGDPADSMLLLLEGETEVEAKNGAKMGQYTEGATFGEISALGLFSCSTVTVRALTKCRILKVTEKALTRAIDVIEEPMIKMAFKRLVENRRKQVVQGLPLTALPIHASNSDVSVRAVALQSERIDLAPGEYWQPLPDSDPCGPHFGVMVKGRALLETCEEGRLVVALTPGSLLPEGMAAEYNTRARAITHCEAYRIRQNDFLVTVYSMPSAQDWFYRFRLLERQTRAHINSRLDAVKGVIDVLKPHTCDTDLHNWKTRRLRAIERAQRVKVEKNDALAKLPLMAHSSAPLFLVSEEAQSSRIFRQEFRPPSNSGMIRITSAPTLHADNGQMHDRGQNTPPTLRLPSIGMAN